MVTSSCGPALLGIAGHPSFGDGKEMCCSLNATGTAKVTGHQFGVRAGETNDRNAPLVRRRFDVFATQEYANGL